MLFKNKLCIKPLDIEVNISKCPTIKAAKLVYVKGNEKLSTNTTRIYDSEYGYRNLIQITLNKTPLVQINAPSCPTCCSILATGYGIDKADCPELITIQENINNNFVSLDNSIDNLKPILALMKSGLYVIADAVCYPVDGNGRFFWNTPDEPTENASTAGVFLHSSDYTYIGGQPVFLYPTQDTNCFNSDRVQYYIEQFKKAENHPRAVLYNFSQFISFIIDGHHKACAASLLGMPLHCIIIIPASGYEYKNIFGRIVPNAISFTPLKVDISKIPLKYFPRYTIPSDYTGSEDIAAGSINHRTWEKEYLDSALKYPTASEFADMISAGIYDISTITDDLVASCISNLNNENQQIMKTILFMMKNHNDPRLKRTAIDCAKKLLYCELKVLSYKTLCSIKNDTEVENFLVDYLINSDDKHDPIIPIINAYWN